MIVNEILNEDPQIGDAIDLELRDTLIETVIRDVTADELVDQSVESGTIGSRPVFVFKRGPGMIYFFSGESGIDALLYLHDGRVMGMKNFSGNSGLIYNLFQYVVNMLGEPVRLDSVDKLTPDGIKWIVKQISRPDGFTITDSSGNPVDPDDLYDEWAESRNSGQSGPTSIVISESRNATVIRENETRLIPMDIYGSTLKSRSSIVMNDLFESEYQGRLKFNDSMSHAAM
jgi:hypothetical protein